MESIVLHSDIARLVLGYLLKNNLKRAALALCRKSPHLQQEFSALMQGLQPHNFLNDGLEDIIREHVKITGLVANAVQKLPTDTRYRMQQLKLSDLVSELLRLEKSTLTIGKDNTCQRKRRRAHRRTHLSDEEHPNSASASSASHVSSKRPRTLAPYLYCSVERPCFNINECTGINESLGRSTSSGELTSPQSDDGLIFRPHGPKSNSTPRTSTGDKTDLLIPTPQAMPELTQAILINEDFQAKLLTNINVALQSLTVHAPTSESVNNEAVLDSLVRNILEATEKDPSFDRIIQEVVGMETSAPTGTVAATPPLAEEPAPPQTPLIIRTAVAAANSLAPLTGSTIVNGESGALIDRNANAVVQINTNSSLNTLIDPNFSISKLIVLNSNESAQKQHPPTTNLSFASENIISFADGEATLNDTDAASTANALAGGQVCMDAINGQLTFPLYLSNEGMLSQLPFLLNNEWLAQQLRPDVFANADISHIEIPLPEPITVTANQLPPQTIIINSAVKQPPLPAVDTPDLSPAQLIELQPKPTAPLDCSNSKQMNCSIVPASLDSSRVVLERVTPSTSGIVNVKAFRSLSTPRKRASHVRTLNFSPKSVIQLQSSPLSSRRPQSKRRRMQLKALKEKEAEEEQAVPIDIEPKESVFIKNVQILPNFGSDTAATLITPVSSALPTPSASAVAASVQSSAVATISTADVSGNESNSCVPPLFAMEESSNQTVIKAVAGIKQSKKSTVSRSNTASAAMPATPKRKQKRRAAVKACKRIISQSETLNEAFTEHCDTPKTEQQDKCESSSLDDSKENQQSEPMQLPKPIEHPKIQKEDNDDLMAAWQRQLHASSNDLEQRLREINAKRQDLTKCAVRGRRQRPPNKKKVSAADTQPAAGKLKKVKTPSTIKKKKQKQHQTGGGDVEFNIKISTPQKTKKSMSTSQQLKASENIQETQQSSVTETSTKSALESVKQKERETEQQSEELSVPEQGQKQESLVESAESDRLANMAVLLETPFKMTITDADAGDVPPTPGPSLMPPLDTPYAKLLPSASFLFGSETKSILDTPMLTAITPGVRLTTPFGHVLSTPHSSAAKTEYSSGSSYYRPDEAEHTDTNAQCALQRSSEPKINKTEQSSTKLSVACIELHAERLPIEPTVLRRVRSFGSEAVDSAEGAAALIPSAEPLLLEPPHYKLVSGLPDTCIDNSSSNSSASSSTSSSSSSSSSSDSSSSSSNSSASSPVAFSQVTSVALPPKTMVLLDMENLSDISSTEDEEWLKTATAGGSQNVPPLAIESESAQLVSQDGEVRYPIRNWLTPSKEAHVVTASADANTSGEMAPPALVLNSVALRAVSESPEKVNQQQVMEQRMQDLAKVRERVKAKVRQQVTPKARCKKTNKKLTAIRETAKLSNPIAINTSKSPKKESHAAHAAPAVPAPTEAVSTEAVQINPVTSEPVEATAEQSTSHSNDLDPALLKALNLSAKKQQQQHTKVSRAAVQIAAQPAPVAPCRQRLRGRPKKSVNTEPARDSMRRSTRLIDNKTPDDLQPAKIEATKPVKLSSANGKAAAKKPAKKRAEARLETAALPMATVAEAQTTTHQSPEQLPQPTAASGDYEFDMCPSTSQLVNTFSFAYDDNGSKPAKPVPCQPASFFRDNQTRLMVDNEMHTMRITNPQLLYQTHSCADDNVAYANIPKKRIIRFTGSAKQNQALIATTSLNRNVDSEDRDDNDMEVASINTPMKQDAGEDQQMEQHDAGVQIEDIESILSHLHGT